MTVLFGYQPIRVVPPMSPCPCGDRHAAMEADDDDPLKCKIRCWCGRSSAGTFDSLEERDEFVKALIGGS